MSGHVNVIGLEARVAQHQRQRHREAARMSRAQQLFGIRALTAFEARCERICALEQTVSKVDLALTFLEAPFQARVRFTCRHYSSFLENLKISASDHRTKPPALSERPT